MKFDKINSWAKINLSLNVIKKLPNKIHSLIVIIDFKNLVDNLKKLLKLKKQEEKLQDLKLK